MAHWDSFVARVGPDLWASPRLFSACSEISNLRFEIPRRTLDSLLLTSNIDQHTMDLCMYLTLLNKYDSKTRRLDTTAAEPLHAISSKGRLFSPLGLHRCRSARA